MRGAVAIALLGVAMTSAAEAGTRQPVMLSGLANFDLGDHVIRPLLVSQERDADARFLAPDIGAPPGLSRKPPRLRIRGRKIRLRIPIG